ncbi:hypothetical protein PV646_39045 [Streptomyces sp. ID05-26A]|nr:hypothetical protein [Streptomyces sp. ID05-26A]
MSSHLFIGDHCWNHSSAYVSWVLEVVAEHVTNEEARAELRSFSSGLVFVEDFGRSFGPEVSEEIVHVIRTELRPAALAQHEGEGRDHAVKIVDELIEMANQWRGFEIEAG